MFGQKQNKKFNYQSRFSKDENSAAKLKQSLNTSWTETRRTASKSKKGNTLFLLIGVLAVLLIVMVYLNTKIK
ncbi:hypothetical protein DZC78_05920 [Olleya aquimaris]|uniref:Uncharacterized protein n=1 Tax=Olleya sediminilitoris TaxID=2795739 RepID=A0ABS1WPF4_9FLAO|nr:hypothetical protein [Olleya sediminilitoris]AXO79944.1 hypothetical protein DZC78_05920 [Olleya aquimaris]MBL7560983.1 hypothetical protein [Olleya sediminilitoris]